jgi:hypothetical protein
MEEEPAATSEPALSDAEREKQERLASVLWRVARGDTSVVSEVYWIQMIEPFEKKK